MPDDLREILGNPDRLEALVRLGLLDTSAEEAFDRLTRLAQRILEVPITLVSLVDDHRQFFKSACGLPEPWASRRATPLSHSLCQHVVASGQPLVIEDAREHPLLRDNLALRDLNVVAYLGMPLKTADGQTVGSFCAIDTGRRIWSPSEQETMRELATSVMSEIALSLANRDMEEQVRVRTCELHVANIALRDNEARQRRMIDELDHRVKNVLARVISIVTFTRIGAASMDSFVETLEGRIQSLANAHQLLSGNGWKGVGLAELVDSQLAPHVSLERKAVAGPDVILSIDATQALAPLFHELVTNAVKYGALKTELGQISVNWRIVETPYRALGRGTPGRTLRIDWQETGGPAVEVPTRTGFGTSMIRESIKHELAGSADLAFEPGGVRCTLTMPMAKVECRPEDTATPARVTAGSPASP